MNCLEFRRAVGADPQHLNTELREHRLECVACNKYASEMLRLDGLIKRALEIPAVAPSSAVQSAPRTRWYAIAASLLLAIGVGGALWIFAYPRDSLASAIVGHLDREPQAMQLSPTRISAQLLEGALQAKGLRLAKPMDDVSYLRSCIVHRHIVPHLVVQTERGPVTVILLLDEHVNSTERFDEQSYHGIVVPTPRGAMAVIATDQSLIDAVAAKVNQSIVWK
jgi:hypothetical protein